ncbi:MAG TPA: glycosyltransferase [Gemmatimonadaceae bacterium]|nr:glycosyltransferase [Gemmatimonadaceae bacterium]
MNALGWVLFALPVALAAYTYGLYPALLWLVARRADPRHADRGDLPQVSVVIPAYNEEAQIRGAIEALIAQDYPGNRRQILILSDASTDRTDEIVRAYASQGVELLRMPTRGGKTAAENASCGVLRGEIVINSDSSVRLHPRAIWELVAAMADPRVGVASTRDVSVSAETQEANLAEAGYVGYEMKLRRLETRAGGIIGASGSGYAIRTVLHKIPIRHDLSRDFAAALTARIHGYRTISVDSAICYVPRTTSLRAEYRRKVRTIARGIETLLSKRSLLDPTQYGSFSWKLLSHKVCRWLVPTFVFPGVLGLGILALTHLWAQVLLCLGGLGVVTAVVGAMWPAERAMPRFLRVATFAAAANLAVVHALLRVTFGHDDHLWEPTRRSPVLVQPSAS